MCEILADYFESVFVSSDSDGSSNHQIANSVMEFPTITYDLVLEELKNLDTNSSPGPDGIHPILLKKCATVLAYPLFILFRKSLISGYLPRLWKYSLVTPLFKSGSKFSPKNYRPISLTCVTAKVMERILAKHIMQYLEENMLISPNQFGFRGGRGTEDQLLGMYEKVRQWVDVGGAVDLILLDYSKAFDKVSHPILIEKLYLLGFDENLIRWIEGFLMERSMSVSVDGVCSSDRLIKSGVPQGTVLGPVLFLIYINFVAEGVSCEWRAFADDFKLFKPYMPISNLENDFTVNATSIQQDLNAVKTVGVSWKLQLNIAKCTSMRFGRRNGRSSEANFSIDGQELQVVGHARDLGVIVDDKLRFHHQVRNIAGKAGGLIGDLLRSTVCRDPEFMLTLFVSHIRPVIEFCSSVWNVGYLGDTRVLEGLQRRWTREISGMAGVEYEDRLRRLNLFSVYGRLLRKDLINIWKVMHSREDLGLLALFDMGVDPRNRGHRFRLRVPVCRSDVRRKAFTVRCVSKWNSLPAEVVECDSFVKFKRMLDVYMEESFFSIV